MKRNLGLVKYIASRFPFDFDDLFQAGTEGLMNAIKRYDISRGTAFSTYATYCIRTKISDEIAKHHLTFRYSRDFYRKISDASKYIKQVQVESGGYPTDEELSEHLKVSKKETKLLLQLNKVPISFDAPVDNASENFSHVYTEENEYSESVFEEVKKNIINQKLEEVLSTLDERDRKVIEMKYIDQMGFREIGRKMGFSYTTANNIEKKTLKLLREKEEMKKIRELL